MSDFKVGDKVFVEAVINTEVDKDGDVRVAVVLDDGDTADLYVPAYKVHKQKPASLCGSWVEYNGDKWWCVGFVSNGFLLIIPEEYSTCVGTACSKHLAKYVVRTEVKPWQPQTAKVRNPETGEVVEWEVVE